MRRLKKEKKIFNRSGKKLDIIQKKKDSLWGVKELRSTDNSLKVHKTVLLRGQTKSIGHS